MAIPGRLDVDLYSPDGKTDRMLDRLDRIFINNGSRPPVPDQNGSISREEIIHPVI